MTEGDDFSTALAHTIDFSPKPEAVFRVDVVDGPDLGANVTIDGGSVVLVGQSPVCTLRLTDATVSRRHLSLEVVGTRLRVRDLDSSNGTFFGNMQLIESLLAGGEVLAVGATRLRVDRERGGAPSRVGTEIRFGGVLGASREMRRLFPLMQRLASSTVAVLIEGETGTGKEVVAQAIHDEGPRSTEPYVVFDCTAVSPALIESELFGHERGAFTGATAQRQGVFEQAHGGTLFIDEIGELPLDLQPKLLRALERGEVRRVGGDKWIRCDVRVVAATRRDIERLVQEERFRDDLFHRLAIGCIDLPPLRRRKGDVLALAEHFCSEYGASLKAIPAAVLAGWLRNPWPGNVRELKNAVARELALGDLSRMAALPPEHASAPLPETRTVTDVEALLALKLPFPEARQRVLDQFQRRYLQYMLDENGGNMPRAAQASGVALRYFQLLRARVR